MTAAQNLHLLTRWAEMRHNLGLEAVSEFSDYCMNNGAQSIGLACIVSGNVVWGMQFAATKEQRSWN